MRVGSLFSGIGGCGRMDAFTRSRLTSALPSMAPFGTDRVNNDLVATGGGFVMPRGAKPKVYPPEFVEAVRRLYCDEGQSQVEVAAALGTTQKVVYNVMRRHGIERRPQIKRDQRGERNATWKGDSAGYQALHTRVARARGKPTHCVHCGTTDPTLSYDWANLTGKYEDVNDYIRLCRSCHWKMDGKAANFRGREVPNV